MEEGGEGWDGDVTVQITRIGFPILFRSTVFKQGRGEREERDAGVGWGGGKGGGGGSSKVSAIA